MLGFVVKKFRRARTLTKELAEAHQSHTDNGRAVGLLANAAGTILQRGEAVQTHLNNNGAVRQHGLVVQLCRQ